MFDKDRMDSFVCLFSSICFYALMVVSVVFCKNLFEFFLSGIFFLLGDLFFINFGISFAKSNLYRKFGYYNTEGILMLKIKL